MASPRVAAYRWDLLPKTSRSALRAARRVRGRLARAVQFDRLDAAVGEVLGSDVSIVVNAWSSSTVEHAPHAIHLETADGSVSLLVQPEPSLITAALARLLRRTLGLSDSAASSTEAIRGAVASVMVESARRCDPAILLRARSDSAIAGEGLRLDATVRIDQRPYDVSLWALERTVPTAESGDAPALESLGALPIRLPIVAAMSAATREELDACTVGDVWLPKAGWLHHGHATELGPLERVLARGALAAPDGEVGVAVECSADGRVVLRGETMALGADTITVNSPANAGTMSDSNKTLRGIALDAPVLVRVEVASVTLSAKEWASLAPGDVIETGVALSEPVVLRVAGREVARGELVDVDGELGVRIREITT